MIIIKQTRILKFYQNFFLGDIILILYNIQIKS